jgi:hypothetical protein
VRQTSSGLQDGGFAASASEQIAHVLATSEFVLSERRSPPAPRFSPLTRDTPTAEFAQHFCAWLLAGGACGREFAYEDIYRLSIRFAGVAGVPLPQADEEFFQALSKVRGVDKKPHRPCRVSDRQQTATTTYTVYSETDVWLIQRSLRRPRHDLASPATRSSGRIG